MQTNYSNISSLHERKEKIKIKFEIIFESFFVAFVFSEFLNMEKKSRGFIISDSLKKWTLKSLLSSGKRLILYSIFFLHLARKVQVFKIPSKIKRNFVLIYKELEPNYNNNVM